MKFRYLPFKACPSPAFPGRKSIPRPVIRIALKQGAEIYDLWAFVDSGADYCYFPSEVGEALGLEVESGPRDEVRGAGGQAFSVYFHPIELIVGGQTISIRAGFGNQIAFAVLGSIGFFDRFEVTFNFRKSVVELKPINALSDM